MKKLIKGLLFTIIALSVFCLTACGSTGGDASNGVTGSHTMSAGNSSGGSNDKEPSAIRTTVSKTEWSSAFNEDRFKTGTVTISMNAGEERSTIVLKADLSAGKYSMAAVGSEGEESFTNETILQKDGDKYYVYNKQNAKWYRSAIDKAAYERNFSETVQNYLALDKLAAAYSDFTYSDGKYKASDYTISGTTFSSITVNFEDGKLMSATLTGKENNVSVSAQITADYAVPTITVPTEYTDAGQASGNDETSGIADSSGSGNGTSSVTGPENGDGSGNGTPKNE